MLTDPPRPRNGDGGPTPTDLRAAGVLCELVDGTLIEKARERSLPNLGWACALGAFLSGFVVDERDLGWVLGAERRS